MPFGLLFGLDVYGEVIMVFAGVGEGCGGKADYCNCADEFGEVDHVKAKNSCFYEK
jgi:hypothetical protein